MESQQPQSEFDTLKVLPGISKGSTYVVVAEDNAIMVAIKPEASMVYFDDMRRFFQIGFRVHVRPREDQKLPERKELATRLNIGFLAARDDSGATRYVGQIRIPACNLTLSPWVVQENVEKGNLIEKLVTALYERLSASGLTIIVSAESLIGLSKERFLDMIPDNKVPLPESKVYFGKDSYYPPVSEGPPKPPVIGVIVKGEDDDSGDPEGQQD